jgi:hypothetical protein
MWHNPIVFNLIVHDITTQEDPMSDVWLPTLLTAGPQEGFELAIKLARMGVKYTQPSSGVRDRLRPEYAEDAGSLIAASHVVATHFQTISAANGHWRP